MRLIDADAFKEYICNAYEQVKHMYPDGGEWARQITEDFCKDIDDQPTIEPQKWIPVSERLPEEGTEVLGTDDHGCIRHVVKDKSALYEFATYEEMMHINIVAWQPPPEAYEG